MSCVCIEEDKREVCDISDYEVNYVSEWAEYGNWVPKSNQLCQVQAYSVCVWALEIWKLRRWWFQTDT